MFRMKQFGLEDGASTMKVGTDAVLLGALAADADTGNNVRHILDVGTGCGIVALMMAQRFPSAKVEGIDIDEASVQEAAVNFAQSPWPARLHAAHCPLQEHLSPISYDIIVSNPPYFSRSLRNEDSRRSLARHDDHLSVAELTKHAARLLSVTGILSVIVPADNMVGLVDAAQRQGLHPFRQLYVHGRHGKAERLCVAEFRREEQDSVIVQHEAIAEADGEYTHWYRETTESFLLWQK